MESKMAGNDERKGFNLNLPLPKFKEDSALDKMSYYDQAAVDSIKLREQIKKDPNYIDNKVSEDKADSFSASDFESRMLPKNRSAFNSQSFQDRNEQKVYEKLRALEKVISQPAVPTCGQDMREFENYGTSRGESEEIKKLEGLMSTMSTHQEPDPELQQLGECWKIFWIYSIRSACRKGLNKHLRAKKAQYIQFRKKKQRIT